MSGSLDGQVAVITGGGTGIGLATAARFVAEGASVVIAGRRQAELDKAVAVLGGDILAVRADVSQLDDLDRLYARVAEEKGRVDTLFANAAVAFLASKDACFINGVDLQVDGGFAQI
jgi:NAD(P)-dependent dehydrogenase (short-subunit alcohol dehydrogenase family)